MEAPPVGVNGQSDLSHMFLPLIEQLDFQVKQVLLRLRVCEARLARHQVLLFEICKITDAHEEENNIKSKKLSTTGDSKTTEDGKDRRGQENSGRGGSDRQLAKTDAGGSCVHRTRHHAFGESG